MLLVVMHLLLDLMLLCLLLLLLLLLLLGNPATSLRGLHWRSAGTVALVLHACAIYQRLPLPALGRLRHVWHGLRRRCTPHLLVIGSRTFV